MKSAHEYMLKTILADLKIETAEQLKDVIEKTIWQRVVVQVSEWDEFYNKQCNTNQTQNITPEIFYCYVPLSVVQEWYLTHQQLDKFIVYFESIVQDVFKVKVVARK